MSKKKKKFCCVPNMLIDTSDNLDFLIDCITAIYKKRKRKNKLEKLEKMVKKS